MPQRLRIFVSSPGDVQKERLRASLIVDKLAQDYGRFFAIEAYLWEHEPMLSSAHFQDAIEPPNAFDIVVLILWSRLGTPLPEKTGLREYRGIDDRAPVTGTEWEYENALVSARAKGLPDLMVFRNVSSAPIDTQDPAARDASLKQLAALDTFWKLHFADKGTFRYAFDKYDTLDAFTSRLEQALRKVIERRVKAGLIDEQQAEPIWLGDPFRGLEAYEYNHSSIFFGRDLHITKAAEQLAANADAGTAFLLVAGASGAGKSSLVKAALVPRLMKPQRITGSAFVRRVVCRAGADATDPFLGLAHALILDDRAQSVGLPELIETGQDAQALATHLRDAKGAPGFIFGNALGRLTRAGRESGHLLTYESAKLLLVVDQLEELFTSTGIAPDDRRQFIVLLAGLARSKHVWVVATLRSDFWARAAEIPEFLDLTAGQGRIDIATPTPAEQIEIIRKPAAAAGLTFEAESQSGLGLDAVLATEAAAATGVLPLLSFTLDELYRDAKARGSRVLTHASYAALGGLEGAIAKRADEVVDSLPVEASGALPFVLRMLATSTAANDFVPVSRAAPLASFPEGSPAWELVDALIKARLVVADESGAAPTARLAHEALIGRWRRAREQLAADRRDIETRAIVDDQFNRWRAESRPARRLLRNPDLANAIDLARRWSGELNDAARDYIKRSARRARLAQTLTALAALVFFGVAVLAVFESVRAAKQQQEAETNYLLALDQAAGSADMLTRGFLEGAVNSRLMADLFKRGQATVNQLPGASSGVAAARAKLLIAMSPAMIAVGDVGKAHAYADAAATIVDDLKSREAGKFEWRELWAEARAAQSLAIFWSGDDASIARKLNEDAIAEFKQLADIAPDAGQRKQITERLIACYESEGDDSRSLGDFDGAVAAYTEWLNRANALADATTDKAQSDFWRSYAADAHLRLGDMAQQRGKFDESAGEYKAGVALAAGLNADEPGNAKFLEHLSLGHGKLGDALIASGDLDQAMREIDQNIVLSDVLVNDLAANIRWLLYQEWSHFRKGRVLMEMKLYQDAYDQFALYLRGVEGMLRRDSNYVSALYDASNAHQWMGDALRMLNKADDAEKEYQTSVSIALDELSKIPTTNQAAKKILAMAYYRLGLAHEMLGRPLDAASNYKDCFAVDFNHNTFTARSNWPEDVTEACRLNLERLNGSANP